MAPRHHPPGYHCSKALRQLGLEADAIAMALRRQLALDTGEIEEALAYPITPPEGALQSPTSAETIDVTDAIDARDEQGEVSLTDI
jgi:hypothetical protein